MQVDFMIIGAQKCGTTALAEQLAAHPQICFCRVKEPGYFSTTHDWQAHLSTYHSLYTPTPGQLCGEASTMYTFLPEHQETHCRLHAYNPALKLIYMMRDPVERVLSNYAHRLVRKTTDQPLAHAIFADPVYINRSRYAVQLRPYLTLFPRQHILLLIFEEYIADQPRTLRQIAEFLAIDPAGFRNETQNGFVAHRSVGDYQLGPVLQQLRATPLVEMALGYLPQAMRRQARRQLGNTLTTKPAMSPALRQLLWRFLEDDLCALEQIMGRRLDCWRQPQAEQAASVANQEGTV